MAMSYFKAVKELVIYNKERTGKFIFWGRNVTTNPREMNHSSYCGSPEAIWGWVSQSSLHIHHTPTWMHDIPEPGECTISCLNIHRDLSGLTHSWTSRQLVSSLHLWGSNIPNSYEKFRTDTESFKTHAQSWFQFLTELYFCMLPDPTSGIICGNLLSLLCNLSSEWHQKGRRKESGLWRVKKRCRMQKWKAWSLVQGFSIVALLTFGAG